MTETELKFQVPENRRERLRTALRRGGVQEQRLIACYVDTPDRRLAGAGMALRLRRENRRWVQTLKGRGDGMFSRFEQDIVIAPPLRGQPPVIDLNRFAGSPAGDALAAALGNDAPPLQVLFTTDVRRTLRLVKSGRSTIEVAFDEGALHAGKASSPLCELEFELKSGNLDDLIALAARWVQRHALWLDVRSKAERGDQLARGLAVGPVVRTGPQALRFRAGVRVDAALRDMVADCLQHLLPNLAEVARDCDADGDAGHLHQARVALRRLRTALALFGPQADGLPAHWQEQLKQLFGKLGAARDRDVLEGWLVPALQAAGGPPLALPPLAATEDGAQALRSSACTVLLLELVRFAAAAPPPEGPLLKPAAADALRRLHRRLRKDAAAWDSLDAEARHRVRKRLKRFRYGVELAGSLWPDKAVGRLLEAVHPVQQLLGELNDLVVARRLFLAQPGQDPGCWFALGWIAARQELLSIQAGAALQALAAAPRFWRRR